jgi:hypothetical protein
MKDFTENSALVYVLDDTEHLELPIMFQKMCNKARGLDCVALELRAHVARRVELCEEAMKFGFMPLGTVTPEPGKIFFCCRYALRSEAPAPTRTLTYDERCISDQQARQMEESLKSRLSGLSPEEREGVLREIAKLRADND